jgi:hypothetical protein
MVWFLKMKSDILSVTGDVLTSIPVVLCSYHLPTIVKPDAIVMVSASSKAERIGFLLFIFSAIMFSDD